MIHQQGLAGAAKHADRPERVAWQNMCATEEGKSKGQSWCKRAIWGNVPSTLKRAIKGGVDALTSGQFIARWKERVDRFALRLGEHVAPKKYAEAKQKAKKKRYAHKKKRRYHTKYAGA